MRARRQRFALVAALTSAAVLIGPGVGSAALGSPVGSGAAGSRPGSVLWTSVRAGDGHAVAADPRGGMVFVAGSTGLVAYDASTGAKLWDNSGGSGRSVAVTPDGHVVFVIKPIHTSGGTWDFSTAAFDAATGRQLWARRYNGRANGDDRPAALAVSPGGGAVFVTGTSQGRTSGRDYATVAYAAATGKQLWVSRYNGHGHGADIAVAIAVSPRGGAVFVTGTSSGRSSGSDFATVAYAAATGATLWVRRYHGPKDRHDIPVAVLVSPRGGGTVVVAGGSRAPTDYLAVAYSAVTGRTKWVSRFVPDGFEQEFPDAAAISLDGRSFYLTGSAFIVPGGEEPGQGLTIAATIATGALSWSKVITTDAPNQQGRSVAASPDSRTVYVVVESFSATAPQDFTTIAFRA